jgi:hypothetical protein
MGNSPPPGVHVGMGNWSVGGWEESEGQHKSELWERTGAEADCRPLWCAQETAERAFAMLTGRSIVDPQRGDAWAHRTSNARRLWGDARPRFVALVQQTARICVSETGCRAASWCLSTMTPQYRRSGVQIAPLVPCFVATLLGAVLRLPTRKSCRSEGHRSFHPAGSTKGPSCQPGDTISVHCAASLRGRSRTPTRPPLTRGASIEPHRL